jgi:hypothetical protein
MLFLWLSVILLIIPIVIGKTFFGELYMRVKYLYAAILMATFTLLQACDQVASGETGLAVPGGRPKPEKEKIKEVSDSMFVYWLENNEAVIAGIKNFDPSLIGEDGILTIGEYVGKIVEKVAVESTDSDVAGDSGDESAATGAKQEYNEVEIFGGYKVKRIDAIKLVSTPAVPAVLDEKGNVVTEEVPEIPLTLESDCIKAIKTLVLPLVPSNGASINLNPEDIVIKNPPDDKYMHTFSVNGKNWYLGGKKMNGIYKHLEYRNKNIHIFDMRYLELTPESPVQTMNIDPNGGALAYDAIFVTAWKGVQNSNIERIIIPNGFTCLEQFAGPNMANSTHAYFLCENILARSGKKLPKYLKDVVVEKNPEGAETPVEVPQQTIS